MKTSYVWKCVYLPKCDCSCKLHVCEHAHICWHVTVLGNSKMWLLKTACMWMCMFGLTWDCTQCLHLCKHGHICQQVIVLGTLVYEHMHMYWHITELRICIHVNTCLCPCSGNCTHVNTWIWANTCPCSGTSICDITHDNAIELNTYEHMYMGYIWP
jgi:hypothetical protein